MTAFVGYPTCELVPKNVRKAGLATVALVLLHLIWASCAAAQEPAPPAGAQVKEKVSQALVNVKGTFADALSGDTEAMMRLATKYLAPAAAALLILIVGYMVASFVGRVAGSTISEQLDETLGKFSGKAIKSVLMLLVLLGVLSLFGVDVTSFAAILAAAGFAIGMALQGTLSNFAAGIMLLVFRPFKVGDYIKVASNEGQVDEIDLFTTRLNTRDNRHLIVPNGTIFGSTIENVTHNRTRRVEVVVGCEYAADLVQTRQVLGTAIANLEGTLSEPAPQVYLDGLNSSSVDWKLRVWCLTPNYWAVREQLIAAAKEALDRADISIPFPQLDLHVVTPGGATAAKAA